MEVGLLLGLGYEILYWHNPEGRSEAYLPDSRTLWEVIWENRDKVIGFAHSHPGVGVPGPSWEDITTFAAVEAALGKRLNWWIINKNSSALIKWIGPGIHDYTRLFRGDSVTGVISEKQRMPWIDELRKASYGT